MTRRLEAPLAGLRVVDMADEKGETCGRFLADLGADVIRVEPPGGARSRRLPLSFAVRNANKRGVTIDLETERERLLALLESADVWIETTRPGTLAALGLGPDDVLARNPELVITSITDFGQTGDYRDWQANDAIHAAMSGILSRSGLAGRDPLPAPRGMATETTAIQAAWATLVAYWNRLRDRPRGSRRLLDPRGGDADHGPRLRHRLGQPRVRLPVDPRAARRPGSTRSSRAPTATCAWSCSRRASGGRCAPGSASPRPSRTSGSTRSRRGSRRRPSCTSSTPRCSPA